MGAAEFCVRIEGEADVTSAFHRARDDAMHESGHGGYTGTIAEKHDLAVHRAPDGLTGDDFASLVALVEFDEEGVARFWKDELQEQYDALSDSAKHAVKKANRIHEDKFAPALGIEVEPKVWVFIGWASM